MKNQDIFQIFEKLRDRSKPSETWIEAESIPFSKRNKIGVSEEGFPIFFISSESSDVVAGAQLELIDILFNQPCSLREEKKEVNGIFNIIRLNSNEKELQQYFINVISIVIKRLPENPCSEVVKKEIQKLIKLFRLLLSPSKNTIQGLWAEMLIILQNFNPDELVKAWHVSATDKYDFNDGFDKLEVKSTDGMDRRHHFAIEQLNPNEKSNLIIASVITNSTGAGVNIFDLRNRIAQKLKDQFLIEKVDTIIIQTLGETFKSAGDKFFDLNNAMDSLRFYDAKKIPTIPYDCIPNEISNVHFICDLTNVVTIKKKDSILKKKLYQGFFI